MKRFDQINMIPFIDIMLVLLAIVLTTASFVSKGLIEVNVPSAKQLSQPPKDQESLEIALNADKSLFFKNEAVSVEQLQERLKTVNADTFIVLRIDKTAAFEQFVQLMDLLKAQQLNHLSIQAQKSS
ncbi:biopolymer transporter ExbD [Thiolinea disciformis]|uniref:biopolymer transporter ExbD n=1 Tax=Thiolinea disciformis TaxID=125614 RepID=UPI000382466A|nr:biopolymer transporter ExbD [Thiolinea disciformis]